MLHYTLRIVACHFLAPHGSHAHASIKSLISVLFVVILQHFRWHLCWHNDWVGVGDQHLIAWMRVSMVRYEKHRSAVTRVQECVATPDHQQCWGWPARASYGTLLNSSVV